MKIYLGFFICTEMTSTNSKYTILKQYLPNTLSQQVKQIQRTVIYEFKGINEVFTFKINNLNLFNQYIISFLREFMQILSNYLFPNVKCLLGYLQFIDYYEEIQFYHYLHFKLNFSFHHSNKNLLLSSRTDQLSTNDFMKKKVKLSQVTSKINRLCISDSKDHTS